MDRQSESTRHTTARSAPVGDAPRTEVRRAPPPDLVTLVSLLTDTAIALVGFGLAWLAGRLEVACLWAAVAVAPHVLRHQLVPHSLRWLVTVPLGFVVVGLQALLTFVLLHTVGADPCEPRAVGWLVGSGILLAATGVLRTGLWIASPLWTLAFLVWWTVPSQRCFSGTDRVLRFLPWSAQAVVRTGTELWLRAGETLAYDDGARIISEGTERLTIDEALADPERFYAACERRVVISMPALFDPTGAWTPGAPKYLRKLRRLIGERPEKHLVIEGHYDGPGAVAVSRARSGAVEDWLRAEANEVVGQLSPDGCGDKMPLVSNPRVNELNRRIEVFLACEPADRGDPCL